MLIYNCSSLVWKTKPNHLEFLLIAPATYRDKTNDKSEIDKGHRAAADHIPSCAGLNAWIQQGNPFQIPDYKAAKNHRTILT